MTSGSSSGRISYKESMLESRIPKDIKQFPALCTGIEIHEFFYKLFSMAMINMLFCVLDFFCATPMRVFFPLAMTFFLVPLHGIFLHLFSLLRL